MNNQIKNIVANQNIQEREYWIQQMSGELEKCILPYDKKASSNMRSMKLIRFDLSEVLNQRLGEICKESDPKLHILLIASINVLLNKYTGSKDIVLGIPIHRQDSEGDLINTILAIRNIIDKDLSFKSVLQKVHHSTVEAIRNQNYPIESILYKLGMPLEEFDFPLFDVVVFLNTIHKEEYIQKYATNFNFLFTKDKNKISLNINYNSEYYTEDWVENITSHYLFLLENLLQSPDGKINDIELLLPEEKKKLIKKFNNTNAEISQKPIIRLMEDQEHKTPDRIALSFKNGMLTYKQLHKMADCLTHSIQKLGIEKGSIVPIFIDHSIELVVAMISVMKAGGVFVPIDVHWPLERVNQIIVDLNCNLVLTDSKSKIVAENIRINKYEVNLSLIHSNDRNNVEISLNDPLFIIYTSGSTGVPKGVVVLNIGISNRFDWMNNYFGINQSETVLHTTRYVYDSVIWQFFWPLINGGKTVIQDTEINIDIDTLSNTISMYNITLMDFVPSIFNIVVDELNTNENYLNRFKCLNNIILGGEEISPKHALKFKKLFPNISITNLYGPTEASIGCVYHKVSLKDNERIPIGKPISNVRIFIVDDNNNLVPIGVRGEICIAGINLAIGYLNDYKKTKDVFVNYMKETKQIVYKTGDIGRWIEDGSIDFIGRKDEQIKIRGYRIEPGEIENKLLSIEGIRNSVVVLKEINNNRVLCAYIVLEDENIGVNNKQLGTQDSNNDDHMVFNHIKLCLSNELPDYMIPSYFCLIREIPLTLGGKVNYKLLPVPQIEITGSYVPPRSVIEIKLVELWSDVLGIEKEVIGTNTDFFEVGGHSLKATVLLSKIHKEFDVKVPLIEIFRKPTIQELSLLIEIISNSNNMKVESHIRKERIIL